MARAGYITLVGTSLLSNFSRERGSAVGYSDFSEWFRLSPSDERNTYPDGVVCRAAEDRSLIDLMASYIAERRGRSCAEVNGVLGIQELFAHSPGDVEIVMMHTGVCNTILTSKSLLEGFRRLGFTHTTAVALKGFTSPEEFDRGLILLVDRLAAAVGDMRRRGLRIYVNATPGFKAESAFLTIASMLLGVDAAVYIHESFNYPVVIPSLPVSLDVESLSTLLKIFSGEDRVHIHALTSALSHEEVREYVEKGVIRIHGEYAILRPWIRHIVEAVRKSG